MAVESATDPPPTPIRYLVAANAAWLAGGVLATTTTISFTLVTAIALLVATPGIVDLRRTMRDEQCRRWVDRAMTFTIGTWATLAMMIVIPYVASEQGASLWASNWFTTIGIVVASLGMLGWNAAAFQGLAAWDDVRSARLYAGFHLLALALALWFDEPGSATIALRGETYQMVDTGIGAGLAAVPGLLWAVVMWRSRPELQDK